MEKKIIPTAFTSIPTVFTLKEEDKEFCDKVFEDYKELFHYLRNVAFYLDPIEDTLNDWPESTEDEPQFDEELSAMQDKVGGVLSLFLNINEPLIKKIESYFIEKYHLKFESFDEKIDWNPDFSLHTYDLIIWNIKSQVDHFPEKGKS